MKDKIELPNFLFRGDSDQDNYREIRATINSGLLLTPLCKGGNGREIFSNSIGQLVNKHIGKGWDKTHFLSFSSEEQTAFHYGSRGKQHDEVYDYKENWDFAVFTFDTTLLTPDSIKEIDKGIYFAQFTPICKEFLPTYNVVFINAVIHLKSIANTISIDLTTAIANATRDSEWLVLPASPFGYQGEFTAKLDTACITDKRVYRYE